MPMLESELFVKIHITRIWSSNFVEHAVFGGRHEEFAERHADFADNIQVCRKTCGIWGQDADFADNIQCLRATYSVCRLHYTFAGNIQHS